MDQPISSFPSQHEHLPHPYISGQQPNVLSKACSLYCCGRQGAHEGIILSWKDILNDNRDAALLTTGTVSGSCCGPTSTGKHTAEKNKHLGAVHAI